MAVESWLVVLGTAPCVVAAIYALRRYRRSNAASEPGYLEEMHRTRGTRPLRFANWEDDDETDDNLPA